MATLSELVKVIAAAQGLDENQVLWIARYLREDGLITKGGRGRGGARMGVGDAANLLIGVNAPGGAKQSADLVRIFCDMPLWEDSAAPTDADEWDYIRSGDSLSEAFRRGSKFSSALRAVISDRVEGSKSGTASTEVVRITLSGPDLFARIYMGENDPVGGGDVWTSSRFTSASELVEPDGEPPDQEVSKTFTHRTLNKISVLLKN
ncbi:hypothetical protein MKK55_10215 [Methylobacterium sp. J-059]|uniref:hypothetical protein n=1 Tax=Methylobacterium sp. J-059 TaxID=2836643 RepID=UPI001FB99A05|nr:hypothetical protein [Methylobacterium sp. J-059]MCJ2039310.1 hypothetical protein [Methylobacterium sp. J-059]